MELLGAALLIGVIPGFIAHSKERPFLVWWFLGTILFPVALIMALLMGPIRRCFYCNQGMRKAALTCPHCGRDALSDAEIDELAAEPLDDDHSAEAFQPSSP